MGEWDQEPELKRDFLLRNRAMAKSPTPPEPTIDIVPGSGIRSAAKVGCASR